MHLDKEYVDISESVTSGIKLPLRLIFFTLVLSGAGLSRISSASSMFSFQEFDKKISAASGVNSISFDSAFGERVNEFDGSTTFYVQDVSVPGASGLPVAVARRLIVQPGNYGASDPESPGLSQFDDWDLDLPSISGVWKGNGGWQTDAGTWINPQPTPQRCTHTGTPFDYWRWGSGITLNWGDGTSEPLLTSTDQVSSQFWTGMGASTNWSVGTLAKFICLPNTKNGYPGEAFLAVRPDGTKYYFDWVVEKPYSEAKYSEGINTKYIPRKQVFALVSRVEDRFGNWVNYTYSGRNLIQISSNDGRSITVGYDVLGRITAVSAGTQTWVYTYKEKIGNQRGG